MKTLARPAGAALLAAFALLTNVASAQKSAVSFPRDQIAVQLGAIQMGYVLAGTAFVPANFTAEQAASALAQGRLALGTASGAAAVNVEGVQNLPANVAAFRVQLDAAVQAVMSSPQSATIKGRVALSNGKSRAVTAKLLPPAPDWSVPLPYAISALGGGGINNTASGGRSTVGGGYGNTASGEYATIGGGDGNTASGESATIAGGAVNTASGGASTVAGGGANTANGNSAAIGGGVQNTASGEYATIAGGGGNTASGEYATIGGGLQNTASGDSATIGGGAQNTNRIVASTVAGGAGNTASGDFAAIGGGFSNTASGVVATIGGGSGNTNNAGYGFLGGGNSNTITAAATNAVIGGGQSNTVSGSWAALGGGFQNAVSRNFATIGGGQENTASGRYATVPGGYQNEASGADAFAAGAGARATNNGAFVWGIFDAPTESTNTNSFTVRATGGVRFITSARTNNLVIGGGGDNGVAVAPGGTAWTSLSDSNAKTGIRPIDPRAVLAKVDALPVSEWEYKHDPARRYFGPMSQDFHAAFGLGRDDKTINTLDADGVLFLSVKGLVEEIKLRDEKIAKLEAWSMEQGARSRAEVDELKAKLQAVEERLNSLPPAP
jgi:hypothetical protein